MPLDRVGSISKWRETKKFSNFTKINSMEILPVLESNDTPKPNLWYVLSPNGDAPCIRVGHTCTFVAGDPRRVLVIGGANPDGSFGDVYSLDLGLLLDGFMSFFFMYFSPHLVYIWPEIVRALSLSNQQSNNNLLSCLCLIMFMSRY